MKNTRALKIAESGDRDIRMRRVFDAPRARVFDAFTRPALLKRWFGPRGWSVATCAIDLKVGGRYALKLRDPNGADITMSGVFREIVASERIVHVESIDDHPGSVITTEFAERNGKTTLRVTIRYPSAQARDAVVKSRMESAAAETYDRLAEMLAGPMK